LILDYRHINKIEGNWILPASKSLSHRYLIAQALSKVDFNLQNISESNDTSVLKENLALEEAPFYSFKDAGTPSRLFIAYASLTGLSGVIDGNEELRNRPFSPLLKALQDLGAEFEYLEHEYSLPLKVKKTVNLLKNEVTIDNTFSSQYVSALMMIAPYFKHGLTIHLENQLTSISYIEMTKEVMKNCGIKVEFLNQKICVENGNYKPPKNVFIESDWSAASYPLMFAEVLNESNLFLPNLSLNSVQGDKVVSKFFKNIHFIEENHGLRIIKSKTKQGQDNEYDLINCPDLFPTLLSTLVFKKVQCKLKGIQNLKFKESDRVGSMLFNLKETVKVNVGENELEINHNDYLDGVNIPLKINSFKDHRIAMAMSLFSLKYPIEIDDVEVVNKSFPRYWENLEKALKRS